MHAAENIANARAAGISSVDVYMFPKPKSGNASIQVRDMGKLMLFSQYKYQALFKSTYKPKQYMCNHEHCSAVCNHRDNDPNASHYDIYSLAQKYYVYVIGLFTTTHFSGYMQSGLSATVTMDKYGWMQRSVSLYSYTLLTSRMIGSLASQSYGWSSSRDKSDRYVCCKARDPRERSIRGRAVIWRDVYRS